MRGEKGLWRSDRENEGVWGDKKVLNLGAGTITEMVYDAVLQGGLLHTDFSYQRKVYCSLFIYNQVSCFEVSDSSLQGSGRVPLPPCTTG